MKILAVDDDAVSRRVLSRALAGLGHEVHAVPDGSSAWDFLQDEPIRVVVSDWMMPEMDGLELCRRIRARTTEDYVYYILVSGREANKMTQREATDAGVDDFLHKPLQVDELWMRLRVAERILQYTRQVRQLEEMLPICSYCKKIRDDRNYWQQIEGYINERTGSEFSHSVCPDCYENVVVPQIEGLKKMAQ